MKTVLALILVASSAAPAFAQYYAPPPYYPPPPPRMRYGSRCDSVIRTPYGPEHMICPIVEPKPLGYECVCPAPRRSGYGGGYVPGRTIR